MHALQHLHTLITQCFYIRTRRRLHRDVAQQLHQVVLHNIAYRTHAVIECAASLNTKLLRHRDLHALDVLTVPDRLKKRIRKTKEDEILYRIFPKIMIDAKDILLNKYTMNLSIQRTRRCKIVPK